MNTTQENLTDEQKAYLKYAKDNLEKEGELEFDDSCGTSMVSMGDDDYPGAYVQAWVWVPKEDVFGESSDRTTIPQTHKDTGRVSR